LGEEDIHSTNHHIVAFSIVGRCGCTLLTMTNVVRRTVAQTALNEASSTGTLHSLARYEAISTSRG